MPKQIQKTLNNARLLKNNGSWIYCTNCEKTVGYLCYSTYQYFSFTFKCKCSSSGMVQLGEKPDGTVSSGELIMASKNSRLCCPNDDSPLFSIVNKNIDECKYVVMCKECGKIFAKNC